MKRLILFSIILFMAVQVWAKEDKKIEDNSSKIDLLNTFLSIKESEKMTSIKDRKDDIIKVLRNDFDVTDEDLAFISSVRAARLPYDGFDFFRNPTELYQLAALYVEAKKVWGKPITQKFYDFFKLYSEKRIQKANWVERMYQLEEAKKRFVLP